MFLESEILFVFSMKYIELLVCWLSFYLESNEIYALRSYEKYGEDPQGFIDTIAIAMDFISSNPI